MFAKVSRDFFEYIDEFAAPFRCCCPKAPVEGPGIQLVADHVSNDNIVIYSVPG